MVSKWQSFEFVKYANCLKLSGPQKYAELIMHIKFQRPMKFLIIYMSICSPVFTHLVYLLLYSLFFLVVTKQNISHGQSVRQSVGQLMVRI